MQTKKLKIPDDNKTASEFIKREENHREVEEEMQVVE